MPVHDFTTYPLGVPAGYVGNGLGADWEIVDVPVIGRRLYVPNSPSLTWLQTAPPLVITSAAIEFEPPDPTPFNSIIVGIYGNGGELASFTHWDTTLRCGGAGAFVITDPIPSRLRLEVTVNTATLAVVATLKDADTSVVLGTCTDSIASAAATEFGMLTGGYPAAIEATINRFEWNNSGPAPIQGLVFSRITKRMHLKLRQSAAQLLNEFGLAVERGLGFLRPSAVAQALYLSSASGVYLDAPWGELAQLPRNANESDTSYRNRLIAAFAAAPVMNKATLLSRIGAIVGGATVTIENGNYFGINDSDWQAVYNAAKIVDGDLSEPALFTPTSKQIYPDNGGAYRQGGILIFIAANRNTTWEAQIIALLSSYLSCGKSFDIIWQDGGNAAIAPYRWEERRPRAGTKDIPLEHGTAYQRTLPVFVRPT